MGAQHQTQEHRAEKERWRPEVEAGNTECAELVCLVEADGGDRWIEPGTPWDLAHTVDGTEYLGPAHARCNRSEGARRGNALRGTTPASPVRWVL